MNIDVEFVPADLNTGVAPSDVPLMRSTHSGWIEFTHNAPGVSLPAFTPTADEMPSAASIIAQEDVDFLEACRERLGKQLENDS